MKFILRFACSTLICFMAATVQQASAGVPSTPEVGASSSIGRDAAGISAVPVPADPCTSNIPIPGVLPLPFGVTGNQICDMSPCRHSTCSPPLTKPAAAVARHTSGSGSGSTAARNSTRRARPSRPHGRMRTSSARARTSSVPTPPAGIGTYVDFYDFVCKCDSVESEYDCSACTTNDYDGDNSESCFINEELCGPVCYFDPKGTGKSIATAFQCEKFVDRTPEGQELVAEVEYIWCSCCL